MECRKCTYFDKKKNLMHGGTVIVGFCRLRQKFISDTTVGQAFCKDKAVVEADESKMKAKENLSLSDLSAKTWSEKRAEGEPQKPSVSDKHKKETGIITA